jgi:hypothetical protein
MAQSTEALRHWSEVVVKQSRLLRADAEAARLRSCELRTKAQAAQVSADALQGSREGRDASKRQSAVLTCARTRHRQSSFGRLNHRTHLTHVALAPVLCAGTSAPVCAARIAGNVVVAGLARAFFCPATPIETAGDDGG